MSLPLVMLGLGALVHPLDSAAGPAPRYTIDVTLDEASHLLRGEERIEYHNRSGVPLSRIYLHLYPNAFENDRTTFAREHGRLPWALNPLDWIPWGSRRGFVTITSVLVDGQAARYTVQETVLEVTLPVVQAAGEAVVVEVSFVVKLPVMQHVFGFRGGSYVMALWHPKLAVPDSTAWRGDGRPAERDFYADLSTYDVRVTTARDLVVAATGELSSTADNGDQTVTRRWLAEKTRFFAWVADRRYRVRTVLSGDLTVQFLYVGREGASLQRGVTTVLAALERYRAKYGPYPHRTLVIAETPALGSGIGGVAFSHLVVIPAGVRESFLLRSLYQGALAHEVAHQWWGMSVGARVEEDDWLIEGLAEFSAGEVQGDLGARRREYVNQARFGFDRRVHQPDSGFDDLAAREVALYAKGPFVLRMLRDLVGGAAFDSILASYASLYRHRRAGTAQFVALAEAISRRDLSWFFDQWLEGTGTCDYGIVRVTVTPRPAGGYRSVIHLARNGPITMPLEVLVRLEDGSVVRRVWDGRASSHQEVVDAAFPVRAASIDPERRLLETRRSNNHYPARVRTSFSPRLGDDDEYRIVHLPFLFYDRGLEAGALLAGGRAPGVVPPTVVASEHLTVAMLRYNLSTRTTALALSYSSPLGWPVPRTFWGLRVARDRRREAFALTARALFGPHFYRGPFHAAAASVRHERPFRADLEFDPGAVTTLELSYSLRTLVTDFYPVRGRAVALSLEAGSGFLRTAGQAEHYRRLAGGSRVALNLFMGSIAAGTAPRQKLMFLSREANFRASRFHGVAGRHLTSLSGELRTPIGTGTIFGLAVFANLAKYWGSGPDPVPGVPGEAGFGLRLFENAAFAVQLDIPVLPVSRPGISLRVGRPFRGPGS